MNKKNRAVLVGSAGGILTEVAQQLAGAGHNRPFTNEHG